MQKRSEFWLWIIVPFLLIFFFGCGGPQKRLAPDKIPEFFSKADAARNEAISKNASKFAPRILSDAGRKYKDAEEAIDKGKSIERIRKLLDEAAALYRKAAETAQLAGIIFKAATTARNDALKAGALQFAAETWKNGEEHFEKGLNILQTGKTEKAKQESLEAEKIYREAELEAIKINHLQDAWNLIAKAEEADVADQSPLTLKKAKELVKKAKQLLEKNRYLVDEPDKLVEQSEYEARHAIYLSKEIKRLEKADSTLEEILLESEKPLKMISRKIEKPAQFDQGPISVARKIILAIDALKTKMEPEKKTEENETEKDKRIREEPSPIFPSMSPKGRIRFARVRKIFDKEEAEIFPIEHDGLMIRMKGSPLGTENEKTNVLSRESLEKIMLAIREFDPCRLVIQSHTNANGTVGKDLETSFEQASEIKKQLIEQAHLPDDSIEAMGFGSTRPIVSGDRMNGKPENQRIEIYFIPTR